MQRKLNKKGIIAIAIMAFILLIILLIIIANVVYFSKLKPVTKEDIKVDFKVEDGDTLSSIAGILEEKELIKSTTAYKIYLKIHKTGEIKIGKYDLKCNPFNDLNNECIVLIQKLLIMTQKKELVEMKLWNINGLKERKIKLILYQNHLLFK